jgi:hypothetical protein
LPRTESRVERVKGIGSRKKRRRRVEGVVMVVEREWERLGGSSRGL